MVSDSIQWIAMKVHHPSGIYVALSAIFVIRICKYCIRGDNDQKFGQELRIYPWKCFIICVLMSVGNKSLC